MRRIQYLFNGCPFSRTALLGVLILASAGCNTSSTSTSTTSSGPLAGTPYYHQTWLATSSDGVSWNVTGNMIFNHASVPGAVRFNDQVYLYFVDAEDYANEKIGVAISSDGGRTFGAKQSASFTGSDTSYPVDPDPIVDSGKIRLTYLANFNGGSVRKIATGTSSDGINFSDVQVIATGNEYYVDPDLFNYNGEWNLFVHTWDTGTMVRYKSAYPTHDFTLVSTFNSVGGAISATVSFNSTYSTYFFGSSNICRALFNGDTLTTVNTSLISMASVTTNGGTIADPTVVVNSASDFAMYFKFQPAN